MTETNARPDAPRVVLSELADALFEAVPHGLVVTDRSGVIQWSDRWFGEAIHKAPQEVTGLPLSRCLVGAAPILRSLRGRKTAEGFVRLRRKGAAVPKLHARAVRGGPRASATVVWVLSDAGKPVPVATPEGTPRRTPSSRPTKGPAYNHGNHLEALRVLHDLSAAPSEGV